MFSVTQFSLSCSMVVSSKEQDTQSYESGRQTSALCTKLSVGVVSLSIFGGHFVLAKVRQDLISDYCSELRGVCFLEVRNVLVLW